MTVDKMERIANNIVAEIFTDINRNIEIMQEWDVLDEETKSQISQKWQQIIINRISRSC